MWDNGEELEESFGAGKWLISRGIYGLHKVTLGPPMPYNYTLCG
jgi:hypothetical protein